MRIALGLEYDGRGFCGWQSQPGGCGIQDALERALCRMAAHPVRAHAAGRTDAAVHASQQIVHFDTSAQRPLNAWVRGVNAFLPSGVAVLWSKPISDDFHARFCAVQRHYRYLLLNHPVRPALLQGRVGWHHAPLDVWRMQAAADCLLGEHDFSSFRAAECQAKSPVKHLSALRLRREADLIVLEISASGFLHHMVRNILGALVHVGKGAQPPEWMSTLLQARNRSLAPPTFMPDGLYFAGARYPVIYDLPGEPEHRHFLC